MDIHAMTFQELKIVAKNHRPRIKQYYIKSRIELIRLLSMKELPISYMIEKMTIQELRDSAKKQGFSGGIWKMSRSELVDLLYPRTNKNHENDNGRKEHNNPQKGEGDEVRIQVLKNL